MTTENNSPSPSCPTPLLELERPSKKICVESGIHMALKKQAEGKSVGLMKWFAKCTPEEHQT